MVSGLLCLCAGNFLRIYFYKIEKRYLSNDNAQHEQCDICGRMLSLYGTDQIKSGVRGDQIKMKVLIVYCHPSKNSFTYEVKETFIKGLESAGHSYEISDLYADGFNPVMSEKEYIREGFYDLDSPVAEDVLLEQKKINEADAVAFIYPDFWTSSPAMLEGWFQRVWTYGFAYGDDPSMKCLNKVLFLITMGGS